MKKKFCAILLTAVFLVSIVSSVGYAAEVTVMKLKASSGMTSEVEAQLEATTYSTTPQSVEQPATLTIKEYEDIVLTLTGVAGYITNGVTVGGSYSTYISATPTSIEDPTASGKTITITGVKQGSTTLVLSMNFVVGDITHSVKFNVSVTVNPADKPIWTEASVEHDGKDMAGTGYWNDANSTFYPGQEITTALATTTFVATTTNDATDQNKWKMTGTFKPDMPTTGDGLVFNTAYDGKTITGKITGTIPSVAKKTTYTLTIDAEDVAGKATSGGSEKTITVKFTVNPKTAVSASNSTVTWGEAFTLTPTISAGNGDGKRVWAISTTDENNDDISTNTNYLQAANFGDGKGLTFDENTGTISGTWAPTTASTDTNIVNFTDAANVTDVTKKVVLQATIGDNTGDKVAKNSIGRKEITLTFKGAKPTITNTASDITAKFNALNSNKGALYNIDLPATKGAEGAINVAAMGPGTINWTVTLDKGTLADYGLETVESEASVTGSGTSAVFTPATLTIKGKPTKTVKNLKLKITASNGKGKSAVIEPTLTIGAEEINIYSAEAAAEGDKVTDDNIGDVTGLTGDNIKVGDSFTSVTLYAKPGPVTWTAKNLPEGITLTPDTKDSTKAVLAGSFKGARASNDDEDKEFEIKAVNANYTSLVKTITGSVMVWAEPEITNATLFKKNVIETGTAYEVEIEASNTPVKNKWKITAGTTSGGTITLLEEGVVPTTDPKGIYTPTTSVSGFTPASSIKVDTDELGTGEETATTDYKIVLVGSLDCVPKNGEKIKFSITAGNNAGTKTKDFEVTVKGKAPALKKEDITLSGTTAKDIKVTAGDGPITMKAYVDAKTAKKIFGVDDEIDLTKDNNVTGLKFTNDTTYKGESKIAYAGGTGVTGKGYTAMAYNKLPVTVEASNSDISSKTASAKYTVTIATSSTGKPSWTSVNDLSATYKDENLGEGKTLGSSHELLIGAGTALPAATANTAIVFQAAGDGPWEVTVKPETKNGLTAAYTESTGKVAITGKVESGKKDVTTKFTLTLKNPSTGETAKSDITIVAKQKPTVDNTTLEKSVLYGKKVKLAPKVTASSNGMKWLIRSISNTTTDYSATTDNTDAKAALKELHGLDFDENKGAISGTPNHATGKDNPITIEMVASTDLKVYTDKVTAKIKVLGEKPKLTTKKVTLPIDETDFSDKIIETNLKGYDTTRANVTFEGNFTDFDAVKGMGFVDGTDNTATFSGAPSAVTKKASITVKMKNYDTETTGKLSITVEGATPEISAVDPIEVTAGSSNTAEVSLSNTGNVSQKIKWKVAKKPNVSGVSAKIKGDASGATITVKANKKVADGATATFSITATDSLSKKTSDPLEVTINVSNPTDTEAAPLEANDVAATPEAKTEAEKSDEKILGEGEVHMGAERTADKLTAQQRKFFEDEGYVIAAVLPEIEVTAAGQYDFEVDLDKEVETGAELVWFAFASKPTTDDEIVDFADEKGKETKVVPESHVVTVAPWLNAETKYAPVIAVKAAAKDADATTVEGVKEAAEAKTEE